MSVTRLVMLMRVSMVILFGGALLFLWSPVPTHALDAASAVKVVRPNGGEDILAGAHTVISWSGGKNTVNVGILAVNKPDVPLGWIAIGAQPNGVAFWDGKKVCDLLMTTCWELSSLPSGPYVVIVVSADDRGKLCFDNASCNYDTSDSSFRVLNTLLTVDFRLEYPNIIVGENAASIVWGTNRPTTAIGHITTVDYSRNTGVTQDFTHTQLSEQHGVDFNNLIPGTKYYVQIGSTDVAGASTAHTTEFIAQRVPVPSLEVKDVSESSATVTWTTDRPSDSFVAYTNTSTNQTLFEGEVDNEELHWRTSHAVTLTNLTPGSTYVYEVVVRDALRNRIHSDRKTVIKKFSAVAIQNVMASVTDTTATITWDTPVPANAVLTYYASSDTRRQNRDQINDFGKTRHTIVLTGLQPNTLYSYEIGGSDRVNGRYAWTDTFTFTTQGSSALTISNIRVQNVTGTGAVILWETNVSASGDVRYNTTGDFTSTTGNAAQYQWKSEAIGEYRTAHTVTLTDLARNTPYYFRVESRTDLNNLTMSGVQQFTTSRDGVTIDADVPSDIRTTSLNAVEATVQWQLGKEKECAMQLNELGRNDTSVWPHRGIAGNIIQRGTPKNGNQYLYEVRLTRLTPNTPYRYLVFCKGGLFDAAAVYREDEIHTFTTGASPSIPTDAIRAEIIDRQSTRVTFRIRVEGVSFSDGGVFYDPDNIAQKNNGFLGAIERVAASNEIATVTLAGLLPGTQYQYRPFIIVRGETQYGSVGQFTTPSEKTVPPPVILPVVPYEEAPNTTTDTIVESARRLRDSEFDAIRMEINVLRSRVKEQQTQIQYLKELKGDIARLDTEEKDAITQFITYGVDLDTKRLGTKARAHVIRAYRRAFGKLPESGTELADLIRIASTQFPLQRNAKIEQGAGKQFLKIFRRPANVDIEEDNMAIMMIAYGVQVHAEDRDSDDEARALKTFQSVYKKKVAKSIEELNIVHAIAYSGATRAVRDIDTDKDGLSDTREKELGTDPHDPDTDGDGYLDGEEVANGYNPLGEGKLQ